jgi:hypothetical protein
MVVRYLITFLVVISCNAPDQNVERHSFSTFSSSCGGFIRTDSVNLQKKMANDSICPQYRISTSEYKAAEQIQWHYNAKDSILDIIHFRKVANCAAQLVTKLEISNTALSLVESNTGNSTARCICLFDLFSSIKLSSEIDTLIIAGKNFPMNLSTTAGTIIIDTTSLQSLGIELK